MTFRQTHVPSILKSAGIVTALLIVSGCGNIPGRGLVENVRNLLSGGLNVTFNDEGTSSTMATIRDPNSSLNIVVHGDSAPTDMSGTTIDGDSFSATFGGDGTPTGLTLGTLQLQIMRTGDETFDVIVLEDGSAKATPAAERRITVGIGVHQAWRTVRDAFYDCEEETGCSHEDERGLAMALQCAALQAVADSMFNEGCLESDEFTADQCRRLLDFIDTLGMTIEAIIAAHPNLPSDVHALCFRLTDDCDTLIYAPQSPDFSDSEPADEPNAPHVEVSISGPTEMPVGGSGTYLASATGAFVEYTWDLLGSGATIVSTGLTGATVRAGDSPGTVTLVVEARDPGAGNVLATATYTISIAAGPEYVVWYDPDDNCWDAPDIDISTRDSFDDYTGNKVEMQGGFDSREAAQAWLCAQVQSRFRHAWCSTHYNIGGSYYLMGYTDCDFSNVPWEN